jgi:hypothetical protein
MTIDPQSLVRSVLDIPDVLSVKKLPIILDHLRLFVGLERDDAHSNEFKIELIDPSGKWIGGVNTKAHTWTGKSGSVDVIIGNVSLTMAGQHALVVSAYGQFIFERSLWVILAASS